MENRRAVTTGGTYRRRADYRRPASPKYNREMSRAGSRVQSLPRGSPVAPRQAARTCEWRLQWIQSDSTDRGLARIALPVAERQGYRSSRPNSLREGPGSPLTRNSRGTGSRGLS